MKVVLCNHLASLSAEQKTVFDKWRRAPLSEFTCLCLRVTGLFSVACMVGTNFCVRVDRLMVFFGRHLFYGVGHLHIIGKLLVCDGTWPVFLMCWWAHLHGGIELIKNIRLATHAILDFIERALCCWALVGAETREAPVFNHLQLFCHRCCTQKLHNAFLLEQDISPIALYPFNHLV